VLKRELVLDLSRLLWRARFATPTGIDRVERAYAGHFLTRTDRKVRFVARMGPMGAREIPAGSLIAFLDALDRMWAGSAESSEHALIAKLVAASRRFRSDGPRIAIIPSHQNWHRRSWLEELRGKAGRLVLFLHDTIPADYPEYARTGGAERHQERLRNGLAVADGFIVNSAATLNSLGRYCLAGQPPPQAVIAPIGLDPLPPPAPTALPDRPYFVCLGTIEPRKNHLLLLHLWRQLGETMPDSAPELVIIGRRGWENENIIDLLDRSRGLKGLVHEFNTVGDEQLSAYVRGARAVLMPSFAEGFGMPVSEALAAGTPVIAADLPAFRETAGEVPLYIDPLDGMGWKQAILAYSQPDSPLRRGQCERIQSWKPPLWQNHFASVQEFMNRLDQ
jgi:glycosyltransferase involved in cell wall biosynthesis